MKQIFRLFGILVLILLFKFDLQAQIYVSTEGKDSNAGTAEAPLLTIHKAVEICQPGDTIWIYGGHYLISERIKIPAKATSEARRCYMWAVPGSGPVIIDGSAMHHTTSSEFKMGRCIYVNHLANYWHFKGLTLCHAEDNGMKIEGSYNIVEQCVFYGNNDTGLQIGMYKDFSIEETKQLPAGEPKFNPGYQFCRGNRVINCDSYDNADLRTYNGSDDGGDADGFACKLFPGPGTEFHGCRAWNNSDDNWDLYMVYHPVVIDSCWAWHAGYTPDGKAIGNGNGFKLGGGGSSGGAAFAQSVGAHVVRNCVSFDNLHKGFDQNNAYEGMYLFNNVAWGNEYNYRFPTVFRYGGMHIRNCVGFKPVKLNHEFLSADKEGSVLPNTDFNSWTKLDHCYPYKEGQKNGEGVKAKVQDYSNEFISLRPEDFMAERQADGSLPDNGFARLKDGSVFKDQGEAIVQFIPERFMTEEEARNGGLELVEAAPVSVAYNDEAPDFGAFELDGIPADTTGQVIVRPRLNCLSDNSSQETVKGEPIVPVVFEVLNADTLYADYLPSGIDWDLQNDTLTLSGIVLSDVSFSLFATTGKYTVRRTVLISVLPPSRILNGGWYPMQDEANALPEDYRKVLELVHGSESSRPSYIKPGYTESDGSIPSGCTAGALSMGRSGGGLCWHLSNGVMKLLVNLHFTGSRQFRISWQTADGQSGAVTTQTFSKGTYTSWDVLAAAGLSEIHQAIDITLVNLSTGGEVRLYDMFVRIPLENPEPDALRKTPLPRFSRPGLYNFQGQRLSQPQSGFYIENGKKYWLMGR